MTVAWRRFLVTCLVTSIAVFALLFLAACSGDETPGDSSRIDLATAVVGDPVEMPAERIVLPPGSTSARWVEVADEQVCAVTLIAVKPSRECFTWTTSLDYGSFHWSPDGATLYFTEDFRFRFDEPDIWSFDSAGGVLTNETDDGTDEAFGDRSRLDTSPFTNDAGELHFFTLGRDPNRTGLSMIDSDGTVRPLPGISLLGARPSGVIHPVGADRFLYSGFTSEDGRDVVLLLDLGSGTTSEIEVRRIETPIIVGAAPGIAIVVDLEKVQRFGDATLEFLDLELDGERIRNVDLGAIDPVYLPTVGFSPDGSALVAIVRPIGDDDLQLIGVQRTVTGEFGEPVTLAPAGFLGTNAQGRARFPLTNRSLPRIVWTDDDQLLIPTDDDVMLVFDLAATGD